MILTDVHLFLERFLHGRGRQIGAKRWAGWNNTLSCHALSWGQSSVSSFFSCRLAGILFVCLFCFAFYVRFSLYNFIFILSSLGLAVNDYKIYRSRLRIGLYPDCRRITSYLHTITYSIVAPVVCVVFKLQPLSWMASLLEFLLFFVHASLLPKS